MTRSSVDRVSRFVSASDGLLLHYLDYGPASGPPVVCLPGLTRSGEDFDRLARALAQDGRRVLALDYRGRGRSEWDQDWMHYNLGVEHQDILATLNDANVTNALFIGTSRGGVHTMLLAAARPELVRAAVINDIGPVVEPAGLMRIKSYVGKPPPAASIEEAAAILRRTASAQFTKVSKEDFETYARLTFVEKDGRLALRYDPALTHALDAIEPESPPVLYWEQWDAMAHIPVLGVRGSNSDLLSEETFKKMGEGHPHFEALTVEGQGHAPLLLDAPTIGAIADFVRRHG